MRWLWLLVIAIVLVSCKSSPESEGMPFPDCYYEPGVPADVKSRIELHHDTITAEIARLEPVVDDWVSRPFMLRYCHSPSTDAPCKYITLKGDGSKVNMYSVDWFGNEYERELTLEEFTREYTALGELLKAYNITYLNCGLLRQHMAVPRGENKYGGEGSSMLYDDQGIIQKMAGGAGYDKWSYKLLNVSTSENI